jgi:hypothetical protein
MLTLRKPFAAKGGIFGTCQALVIIQRGCLVVKARHWHAVLKCILELALPNRDTLLAAEVMGGEFHLGYNEARVRRAEANCINNN